MATFAPDVKETQASSYLGLSQPISPLKNYSTSNGPDVNIDDKSAGTVLQGLGNLFEGVVKAGDSIVKKTIEDELYKKIDEKREGYTSDLEKAGNIPQVQRVADVAGNQPPQPLQSTSNILPDRPDGPLPTELARLPDTLGNLQSASGKLSPTYYTGRLDLIAKDLRTRFPGYRDYIDKQVESITGENPANAYVKQLMAQINHNSENGKSEREKMIAYVHQNDNLDGAGVKMQMIQQGKGDWADLVGWAGATKIPMENMRVAHAKFEAAKDDIEGQKIIAKDAFTDLAQRKFSNFWNTTTQGVGLSPAQITENAQKVQRGEEVPGMGPDPSVTAIKWSQALSSAESAARQELIRAGNVKGPSGRSMAQALGPEEFNKHIDSVLAPYKDTQALLSGKAIPMAAATAEINTALVDESTRRLFADKDLGAVAKTYAGITQRLGPNAGATFIGQQYANGLPAKMKMRLDHESMLMVTPNNGYTLKAAVEGAAKVGVGAAGPDPSKPPEASGVDYFKELFAKNRFIGDKDIPIPSQQEVAKKFYGPGNEGLISKFAKDSVDPVTGEYMEGNIDVFRRLYGSKSVIKGMKTLGEYDGQSWDMFKTSADKAFVNEVFTPEIKNMETYQNTGYMKIIYHADRDDKKFEVKGTPRQYTGAGDALAIATAKQSVDRLNKGFEAMSAIAKEEGRDPNAYVLGTMFNLGLDPKKIEGIGPELMRSVLVSKPAVVDPFNTRNEKKNQSRVGQ